MTSGAPRRRGDLLLTVSAVAGVVCLLVIAVMAVTHSRPVAFRSGSMSPTIDIGAVAVVHRVPARELRVGDVVTVPTGDTFVTHRVVQLTRAKGAATLQLQGDANDAPDAQLHEVDSAERVVVSVPKLGYLLGALTGPFGWLLAGTYVVWLLRRLGSGGSRDQDGPAGRHRGSPTAAPAPRATVGSRSMVAGSVLVVVALGSAVVVPQRADAAGWPDTVGVSGTVLTAHTVPVPATFTCGALGLLSVRFDWTAVPGAVSYDVHYGPGGSSSYTVTTTAAQLAAALAGSGTAWVQANMAYGSTTWTSAPSVSRTYTVAVVSLCS